MATFYRNMMEEEERKHDSAVEAASKAAINKERKSPEAMEVEITREKRLAEQAKKLNAKLGTEAVLINDEGEVVDKRQLLKGGLNILPKEKPTQQVARSDYQTAYEARRVAGRDKIKRESQQRQQRVIEEQYAVTKKRAADVEAEKEEELRLRAKSKKTSNEVMGARERYLARKQAAAQGS
jgi:coiled-coil domain-containing protein 55